MPPPTRPNSMGRPKSEGDSNAATTVAAEWAQGGSSHEEMPPDRALDSNCYRPSLVRPERTLKLLPYTHNVQVKMIRERPS